MHIISVIEPFLQTNDSTQLAWSFEFYPPKTVGGMKKLQERMIKFLDMNPLFLDVTFGAGGSTSKNTLELLQHLKTTTTVPLCMHLVCTNLTVEAIDDVVTKCLNTNINNILALRGDPPENATEWVKTDGGFQYASQLVTHLNKTYYDRLCISVAGFPEGHLDSLNEEEDVRYLKEKVDSGADYIVSQFFYDIKVYLRWVHNIKSMGITCPIIPGILPIHNYNSWKRMTTLCKVKIPPQVENQLEDAKDDPVLFQTVGKSICIALLDELIHHGCRLFHFYTLNMDQTVEPLVAHLNNYNVHKV